MGKVFNIGKVLFVVLVTIFSTLSTQYVWNKGVRAHSAVQQYCMDRENGGGDDYYLCMDKHWWY